MTLLGSLVLAAALAAAQPAGSSAITVRGIVVDASGAPVGGARVAAHGAAEVTVAAASDGRFELQVPYGDSVEIVTSAPGFAEARQRERVDAGGAPLQVRVTLLPAPLTETLVVTATRGETRTSETAAPVSVLTAADLLLTASPALDDALRVVPGFSLFRRTSSRVANPTTQGASLRGLAASGASRALVLADGIPLNDPFGGWVYWNRVPQMAIERVEVVRGGVSDVYGVDALAGVVQILTGDRRGSGIRAGLEGGSYATARASAFGAVAFDAWRASMAAEASRTDGTWVIEESSRGPIDAPAGGDYLSGSGSIAYQRPGSLWQARLRADAFGESRRNGTVLQENDTSTRQLRADVSGQGLRGFWEIAVQGGSQTYNQSFSAIGAERASETLTVRQHVPASHGTGALSYRRPLGAADLLVGADIRQVDATNIETAFAPSGAVTRTTETDGSQRSSGLYAQLRTPLGSRTTVTGGVRGDLWQPSGDDAGWGTISPRLAASYRIAPAVTVRGSVASSFRAPTLNERYRAFRVGNVITLANEALEPEELLTVEGGVLLQATPGSVRATVFVGTLDNAVTNVTLSSTPQLITRQRQNAGGVRATGLEIEGELRTGSALTWTGSAGFTRSRFRETEGLTGNTVPQVPSWQLAGGVRWVPSRGTTVQGLARAFSDQFEDDRNILTLRRAAIVDASVSHVIDRRLSLFAAVENLFDVEYDTGRTPLRTIGMPRAVHVGARVFLHAN